MSAPRTAVRISQPDFAGTMVVTFADEGRARLVVDALSEDGDDRTQATFLGRVSTTPLHFAPCGGSDVPSLRRQALEHYDRALPHRVGHDVLDLVLSGDRSEASCLVLGGWR